MTIQKKRCNLLLEVANALVQHEGLIVDGKQSLDLNATGCFVSFHDDLYEWNGENFELVPDSHLVKRKNDGNL